MYVKLPSAFRVSVPWLGPLTRTAFRVKPPASVSLASTPGAATFRVTFLRAP